MPVIFYSSTYLYEKYGSNEEKAYNFAVGTLKVDYKTEIIPMVQDVAKNLNEVFEKKLAPEKIVFSDLFGIKTENTFPLFTPEFTQDGTQTGFTNISLRSRNNNDRLFLFEDFAETKPIAKEDAYKYEYAIEVEIKAYFDDEKVTKGIFAIFHRGIKSSLRSDLTDSFSRNDKAWEGFDFTTETEDDLPF
jgi:hypothetical protein